MVNPYFNNAIPQANDALSKSQRDLLGNNSQLNVAWQVNHESFNVADQGKHNLVTMPARTLDVQVPATGATEMTMFCQLDASNTPIVKIKPAGAVLGRTGQQISPFPSILAFFKIVSPFAAFTPQYRCSGLTNPSTGVFVVSFLANTITGTQVIPARNLFFSVQAQNAASFVSGSVTAISTAGNGTVTMEFRNNANALVNPDSITFFMWGDADT